MAKKVVEYEDMEDEKLENQTDSSDEFEFDEEDFEIPVKAKVKHGKKKGNMHYVFFAGVLIVLIICGISLYRWNLGVDADDGVVIDEAEFDTEPNDYIQPLTTEQLAGKVDDGVTTILALGNSPFADNGKDNNLARAISKEMNATVINAAIPDSYQTRYNPVGDDSNPADGISLVDVVEGLTSGDCSKVIEAAAQVSDTAANSVKALESIDMSKIDCAIIFYDLSDYIDHRNIYNPGDDYDVTTFGGALATSIKMIQEKYPYIRIVVMSVPASGKTIDGYYVDGMTVDLANGTLNDYIGREVVVCATEGVSFVDLCFGAIHVDNRDKYLIDDYHINDAGATVVAKRFAKLIVLE